MAVLTRTEAPPLASWASPTNRARVINPVVRQHPAAELPVGAAVNLTYVRPTTGQVWPR